eukprot:15346005-Ditylum_brightwellii.AAC.1
MPLGMQWKVYNIVSADKEEDKSDEEEKGGTEQGGDNKNGGDSEEVKRATEMDEVEHAKLMKH